MLSSVFPPPKCLPQCWTPDWWLRFCASHTNSKSVGTKLYGDCDAIKMYSNQFGADEVISFAVCHNINTNTNTNTQRNQYIFHLVFFFSFSDRIKSIDLSTYWRSLGKCVTHSRFRWWKCVGSFFFFCLKCDTQWPYTADGNVSKWIFFTSKWQNK